MLGTSVAIDLWRDKVVIPTIRTYKFGSKLTGPVSVLSIFEPVVIADHISAKMREGNIEVSEEEFLETTASYWTMASGIASLPTYSKQISSWSLDEQGGNYTLVEYKRVRGGGMVPDQARKVAFPPGTSSAYICARVVDTIKEKYTEAQRS